MKPDEILTATESSLLREADTLGDLLALVRSQIPTALIDGTSWEDLKLCATRLPSSLAATSFGFEVRLDERLPRADLGITVTGGTRSADLLEHASRESLAAETYTATARLLDRINRNASDAEQMAIAMLEFDLEPGQCTRDMAPGIFVYPPIESPVVDRSASWRTGLIEQIAGGVASLGNWKVTLDEYRTLGRISAALTANSSLRGFGVFPSRSRFIRVGIVGFRSVPEVADFLERLGWPRPSEISETEVGNLANLQAFSELFVHLDVTGNRIGPRLGISVSNAGSGSLSGIRPWKPTLQAIRESRLAIPEKLSALEESAWGVHVIYGKGGRYHLLKYISHIKFAFEENRISQTKAYLGMRFHAEAAQAARREKATSRPADSG